MKDDSEYLDGNGDDLRFGERHFDVWLPDPPMMAELKKSGDWYRMLPIHQRWVMRSCYPLDQKLLKKLSKSNFKAKRKLKALQESKSNAPESLVKIELRRPDTQGGA
jgi:hypothetical protein